MTPIPDPHREFLRHTMATLAYRAGRTLRDAPDSFASFRAGETTRTPAQILAHIGDLFDWALSMARGATEWHRAVPLPWGQEVARFFCALKALDDYLGSSEPLHTTVAELFQGPVADALTHVGQLAMLRRLAGVPIRGENYAQADIAAGRIGPNQAPPRREFG